MCGRYALHASPEVIALQFGLASPPAFEPSYNVCPGTEILAVGNDRAGRRVAARRRWGLVPSWAKGPAIGSRLVNARGETLAEKPAFREAFRRRRCLVPASGYYEWQAVAGRKQPWYVRPLDEPLFALAAIAERWRGPEGALRTLCLITTPPNALMAAVHDRMPLVIAPEDYEAWLDPRTADASRLVRPYPAQRMRAHAVSSRVSSPANDDAGLVEPV